MMQRNSVRFSCTALAGTGKVGRLPKDANGYYTMPLGGLNVFNSVGEYYTYEGAKELFTGSAPLMRRVSSGCLKGEYGHPKPDGPITTEKELDAFARRVMSVQEKNTCVHYADIWLDFDTMKNERGGPQITVMGKLTPSGPLGHVLERSLENPLEEVCFSIRAFTEDNKVRGVQQRTLREIVTWDFVTEPGLSMARKFKAPALESRADDIIFKRENIISTLQGLEGVAMESTQASGLNLIRAMGWDIDPSAVPKFLNW